MNIRGFDKSFYLNEKLNHLASKLPEWSDKDAVFLEDVLANTVGLSPEEHYQLYGYKEGLGPNAYFNHEEYRFAKAKDLLSKGAASSMEAALDKFDSAWQGDVYLHYLHYGAAEGINPSNSFDDSIYLADKLSALKGSSSTAQEWTGKTIFDLRSSLSRLGMTVLEHYLSYGIKEGMTASPVPPGERVDPSHTPWEMPHEQVNIPQGLNLDWVDTTEIKTLPHRAIGQIYIPAGNKAYIGTGFMISPKHVLTSAHVVYDEQAGGVHNLNEATFSAGRNGDSSSADQYSISNFWVQQNYLENPNSGEWPDDDLAILTLSHNLDSSTGYLKLPKHFTTDLVGLSIQSAGYPSGDIEQDDPSTPGSDFYQWEVNGKIDQALYNNGALGMSDSMTTQSGASGSPIFYEQDNEIYFTGVYSGTLTETRTQNEFPVATAMDQDSYNWILGVLQQDGYYSDYIFI